MPALRGQAMNIKYPEKWVSKKVRINAYGVKAWGDVNYEHRIFGITRSVGNIDYIRGYRQAIEDIKKLNANQESKP